MSSSETPVIIADAIYEYIGINRRLSKTFTTNEIPYTKTRNVCFFFVIKIHCKILVAKKIGRDKDSMRSGGIDGLKSCLTNTRRGEKIQTKGTSNNPREKKRRMYRLIFFI